MEVQQLHPKPGQRVILREAFPYQVPKGLSPGQEVTAGELDNAAGVSVRDDAGQEFRVPIQCVEMERIYFVEGRWRRELHPLVVADFRKTIEELESTRGRWQSGIEWINEANLKYARGVIARAEERELNRRDAETQRRRERPRYERI